MADSIMNKVKQDKLHWIIKHKTSFKDEEDFLETILMDCGVKQEDIPKFLNPNRNMIHDGLLMKNMREAVDCIRKHIQNGSKIKIKVDVDVDGYTSSSVLGQFLTQDIENNGNESEIEYIFSEAKEHGLTYDMVKNYTQKDMDLIIIPDASMTVKDSKLITKNFHNVDIVVLDHHLIEEENEDCYTNYCIAVNCHDGQYPNSNLSGVGVVQKFIESWKELYPEDIYNNAEYKYLDLVSLGIASDQMSLISLENRYYVIEGLKKAFQNNDFLNEIENKFPDDFKFGRTITNMTWKTAPLINGTIRFGKPDEIKDMLFAMAGEKRDIEYQPRRKNKNDPKPPVEIHSLQWEMAKTCYNVKQRQDSQVRKLVDEIDEKIQKEHLDMNSILFVEATDILGEKSTVTGLISNKLASKYFRPVVLMKDFDKDIYGGSARAYGQGNLQNLKSFLEKYDGFEGMGHEAAFGLKIQKEKLSDIIKQVNKDFPLDTLQTIHKVDWEIPANKLKKEYVSEVAQNYEIWGNDVPSPEFVITNLVIPASEINGYGENNNFIRFTYNGIVFTKKYCSALDYDTMICKSRTTIGKPKYKVRLNIICQFVLNAWEDKVNPEVKILYFDSVKDDGKSEIDDWFDEMDSVINNNTSDRNGIDMVEPVSTLVSTKKEDKQEIDREIEQVKQTEQTEEPIKKKRGRPPKKREPLILDDEIEVEEEPKKRGRPPKNKEENKVESKEESKENKENDKVIIKMQQVEDIDDNVKNYSENNIEEKCEEKVEKVKKKVYTVEDEDFIF